MKPKTIEIQRAIIQLQNPYPKDDLITNYNDFLKYRDFLHLYQFNIKVFEALIKLSNDLWFTNKKISRISILTTIKRYGYKVDLEKNYYRFLKLEKPSEKLKISIFNLFKRCFDEETPLSKRQVSEAKGICSGMLFYFQLNSTCEQWLCDNAFNSNLILNRVLKYPAKSTIISNWVKKNYTNDNLRTKRAELVSWLIDEDFNFSVNKETLITDFEYLNSIDEKALENFVEELEVIDMMEAEFKETMENRDHSPLPKDYHNPWLFPEFEVHDRPLIKKSTRFHEVFYNNKIQDENYNTAYDIDEMRKHFHENLAVYTDKVMIWSIYFSRLNKQQKTTLLKKYYSIDNYFSFLKIAKRLKSVALLKWLIKQPLPDIKRKTVDLDVF